MTESVKYRTEEGDTVEFIVWKHYGEKPGIVEQVLEANQNLSDYGVTLPAGLIVDLPVISSPEKTSPVSLWD